MGGRDRHTFGSFVLEKSQQRLSGGDGTPVPLTPRLFNALVLFVEHPGELLDKDILISTLWPGLVVEENNLSQVIFGLRRALGDDGTRFIQTVPKRGFRFIAKVDEDGTLPLGIPVQNGSQLERRYLLGGAALAAVGAAWSWWPATRKLAAAPELLPEKGGTRSIEANELTLTATRLAHGRDIAGIERGIRLLERALAIDPNYALAWVRLAALHRRRFWNSDAEPKEVFLEADRATDRALALAPDLAEAHVCKGLKHLWYDFDRDAAEREFRRAIALDPNDDGGHFGLGVILFTGEHPEEGFAEIRRYRELSPTAPLAHCWEARLLRARGRPAEARLRVERALDLAPTFWIAHTTLGQLQFQDGKSDEGFASMRRAVEYGAPGSRPKEGLAVRLVLSGRRDEARAMLEHMRERARERYVPPSSMATIEAALGENDAAIRSLERAMEVHDDRMVFLKDESTWVNLRGDRRFAALLSRLKLDGYGPGISVVPRIF